MRNSVRIHGSSMLVAVAAFCSLDCGGGSKSSGTAGSGGVGGTSGSPSSNQGGKGGTVAGMGTTGGSSGSGGSGVAAGTGGAGAMTGSGGADLAGDGGSSGDADAGDGSSGGPASSGGSSGMGSGDPDFDACIAALEPNCVAHEMDTAELMEVPCASMTMIPIPLSDGKSYGPKTIVAGPYGGKTEWNEGAGTEFVNEVNVSEPLCVPIGIQTFMEPASVNAELLNLRDVDYSLYTIFRPACFKAGETYPVITWANGTCGEVAGYAPLLTSLASHGFVIIASNSTWTNTVPTNQVQVRALDYAEALNEDPSSVFYQRLDMTKVGAMGHSQGAAATGTAEDDPRVKSVIFWNTGTSNVKPFLDVSGERDVVTTTPESLAADVDAATQPGAWVYHHQVLETGGAATGHLVLMMQPERVLDLTIAWWNWQLSGDEEAKKMFVGDDCGLCSSPDDFEFGHNNLLK